MVYATWIIAVAGIVSALAAVVSAIAVRDGITEQTKNFEKQATAYRFSLSVEVAFRLEEFFDTPKFQNRRSRAALALLNQKDEGEAEYVFDFFDTVGLFVKLGALSEQIAYSMFFHWINLYWRAGKRYIGGKQKEVSQVWKDFEWLFERVSAVERKRHPDSEDLTMPAERLKLQLQEEYDL